MSTVHLVLIKSPLSCLRQKIFVMDTILATWTCLNKEDEIRNVELENVRLGEKLETSVTDELLDWSRPMRITLNAEEEM